MAVTPQTNTTLAAIGEELMAHDRICICGHMNPDGDCLGSQLALAAALRATGKAVDTLLATDDAVDQRFRYLPGFGRLIPANAYDDEFDLFVAVDVPTTERLADAAAVHDRAPRTITIDHHAVESRMADLSYTDPDAPSTTVLIWDLLGLMPEERSADVALCAYTGLVTDTGRFQYQNADYEAFRSAAEMVAAGADPSLVSREVYQQRSLASVRLEALALERMELLAEGRAVLSYVTLADMEEVGAVKADTEPLIDALRNIAGVRLACMLRAGDGIVRGSLRAKDDTDVAAIAREFNGGGHRAAAGFTFEGTLDEARSALATRLVEAVEASAR